MSKLHKKEDCRLRFPEFDDEWKEYTFKDLVDYERPEKYIVENTEYNSKAITPVLTANKGFILGYTDEKFGIFSKTPVIIFDDFTTDSKYVDFSFKVKSSALKILKLKDSKIASLRFIYEKMKSIDFPHFDHKRYYISEYQNQKVLIPNLDEQEKISSFLSCVDDYIDLLELQKKKIESYRESVLRNILSKELRFKDERGENYPDWEYVPLGEVFRKGKKRNTDNACTEALTISAIQGVVKQRDYFDKDIANKDNLTNYHVINQGDFVYNPRISKHAPVGPLRRNNQGTGIVSPLYTVLKLIKGDSSFYESYFLTSVWHGYMHKIANYGARHDRMNIASTDFMKMPVPFPSVGEQKKIAGFVLSIQELISTKETQISLMKDWKIGLVQKMT